MSVPDWWAFLLLGLGAWSVFELLAFDSILDKPRRWVLRLGSEWQPGTKPGTYPPEPYEIPDNYRLNWAIFLNCPYCAGFWIWVGWIALWEIWNKETLIAAAIMGGRTMVVALDKVLRPEEHQ